MVWFFKSRETKNFLYIFSVLLRNSKWATSTALVSRKRAHSASSLQNYGQFLYFFPNYYSFNPSSTSNNIESNVKILPYSIVISQPMQLSTQCECQTSSPVYSKTGTFQGLAEVWKVLPCPCPYKGYSPSPPSFKQGDVWSFFWRDIKLPEPKDLDFQARLLKQTFWMF